MDWAKQLARVALAVACIISVAAPVQAAKRDAEAELNAAFEAANAAAQSGPADIALKAQATLKLPEGFVYIPQPHADRILNAMGNGNDPTRLGIIFPQSGANWFVVARYIDSGYIKDEEARDWKTAEMLDQIKAGTEESNKDRADLGLPAMEIVGWVQEPKYDDKTHRLVWSIASRNKGDSEGDEQGINFNTFVLGREGYISMNLVTGMRTVDHDKIAATTLLENTSFNDGKTYADFNASTDRVAEYGIATLVAGAAAKKLGLFAAIAAFLAKFAKVFILAAVALFAAIRHFFSGKKS